MAEIHRKERYKKMGDQKKRWLWKDGNFKQANLLWQYSANYPDEGKEVASKETNMASQTTVQGAQVVERHVQWMEGGALITGWE